MKKANLFVIMLLSGATALAQSGSWYVGGQLGLSSTKTENFSSNQVGKTTMYNASPEFGTFIKDDLLVGFALNFSTTKVDNDVSNTDYTENSLISPVLYVRKFWSIQDVFSTFVGLDVNFSSGSAKQNSGDVLTTTNKISGFGANLNVGVALPLGDRFTAIGKYGLLGYSSTTDKNDAGVKQSTDAEFGFGVNSLGSVFNVGLYYTFIK